MDYLKYKISEQFGVFMGKKSWYPVTATETQSTFLCNQTFRKRCAYPDTWQFMPKIAPFQNGTAVKEHNSIHIRKPNLLVQNKEHTTQYKSSRHKNPSKNHQPAMI